MKKNGDESDKLTLAAETIGKGAGVAAGTATGIVHSAQDYGDRLSEAATQAKGYVSEKATVVGERIKALPNTDFNELAETAKAFARKNPGQALLISAAAGLVLGLLIRGRRS
jgi:ElaB/YqjD/DUF883 family membrane-anchored ribosome-binding protein